MLACVALACVALLVAAVAVSVPKTRARSAEATPRATARTSIPETATIEVPKLTGATLKEAQTLVGAAGLKLVLAQNATGAASARIESQTPVAGSLVTLGSEVSVSMAAAVATTTVSAKKTAPKKQFVVVLDAGHQARSDPTLEPVGPKSAEKKARCSGGATGVVTHVPEYEIALQLATNLKARLEQSGVKVIMTRTTNDVNISNIERANVANRAKADLFVRIHADSSADQAVSGISTLYPANNSWTRGIYAPSLSAAQRIQRAVVSATGSADKGTVARSDLAGFNFSKVPSVLVETGFMSNAIEDRLLASPKYQDRVTEGLARGILAYLKGQQ